MNSRSESSEGPETWRITYISERKKLKATGITANFFNIASASGEVGSEAMLLNRSYAHTPEDHRMKL